VLEHVPGGSLDDVLWGSHKLDRKLKPVAKVAMAADAACGLLQVHSAGLLHRDVAARCACGVAVVCLVGEKGFCLTLSCLCSETV